MIPPVKNPPKKEIAQMIINITAIMYNKLPMMKKDLRFKNVYIVMYIKLCQKNNCA